ncbi:MAG: hypothetical protein M3Y86_02485 [Verrucomicrobiota bacterium]|nr:hypothetical protein [Verrucomicrobiota bacterium]
MKTIRPLLLALCATLAFSVARATTVIPPTFDQLVSQAQLIIDGTVTDVTSQWTGEGAQRHIVSYVTVKVADTLKGDAGGPSYTLRMLGGTVGTETMEVSDSPKFQVGDRDILFVENNGTQFIPLVGIMHGRFHVAQDKQSGVDMVLADNGSAVTNVQSLGRIDETGAAKSGIDAVEKPLDVQSFKAAIRDQLAGSLK